MFRLYGFYLLLAAREVMMRRKLVLIAVTDNSLILSAPYGVEIDGQYYRQFVFTLSSAYRLSLTNPDLVFDGGEELPIVPLTDLKLMEDLVKLNKYRRLCQEYVLDHWINVLLSDPFKLSSELPRIEDDWRHQEMETNRFGIHETRRLYVPVVQDYHERLFRIIRHIELSIQQMSWLRQIIKNMEISRTISWLFRRRPQSLDQYFRGPRFDSIIDPATKSPIPASQTEYGITIEYSTLYFHTPWGIYRYELDLQKCYMQYSDIELGFPPSWRDESRPKCNRSTAIMVFDLLTNDHKMTHLYRFDRQELIPFSGVWQPLHITTL